MMKSLFNIIRIPTVLVAVGLFLISSNAGAQQLGIKTNALMWAGLTPNLGCEVVVGQRSSIEMSVFGNYKPYGADCRLFGVQPEYRYWFSGRPMTREFVGATVMVADYDLIVRNHSYDGYAVSMGITGGYSFSLGVRWRLELCGGFALMMFNHKHHYRHDNYDDYFIEESVGANAWGYKLIPAKLGVTFTYIIK